MDVIRRFFYEDEGGQVTEYALVLGLIAIVCVLGITMVGDGLEAWWLALGSYVGTLPAP